MGQSWVTGDQKPPQGQITPKHCGLSGEITRPCGCSCGGTGRGMLQNVEKAKKTRRSEVGGRGLAESEGRLGNDGEAKEGAGGKGEERGLRGPKLFGRLPEGLEGERLRGKQGRKV